MFKHKQCKIKVYKFKHHFKTVFKKIQTKTKKLNLKMMKVIVSQSVSIIQEKDYF